MNCHVIKDRAPDDVFGSSRIDGVKSQRIQHIPRAILALVIHTGKSQAIFVASIHESHDLADHFLSLPGDSRPVVKKRSMMIGLVAMTILPDHSSYITGDTLR